MPRTALGPVSRGWSPSRRGLLRAAVAGGVGASMSGLLAACGLEGAAQSEATCRSTDRSERHKVLTFSNWPEYIDVQGTRMPTLEGFETRSGIDVTYTTDINDNNEFFAKVQNQLGSCEPIGRDIITLSDWMAARMIELGWAQTLDRSHLANVEAQLVPSLRAPAWDPDRDHSVPWQSGFTGIAYNARYTREVGSFEELLTRQDLKGRISLLKEMRDTMGFMLTLAGADPTDFTDDQWDRAIGLLEERVASGQVRRFTGNDYTDDLNNGDIIACEAWSGDIIALQYDNPDIKWVVPEEGLALWSDNMLVPNRAEHKANAEALIDYYYDPEVAARLSAWVNYICPVQGAREAMTKVDPSLVDAPLIFPDDEFLARSFAFKALDIDTARKYDTDFFQAIG